MIKVNVTNSKTNQTYGGEFQDATSANAWIAAQEAQNSWGKPKRDIVPNAAGDLIDIDGTQLSAADAIASNVVTDVPAVPGVAASYTGTPAGLTTAVTITANTAGTGGNVSLTADGASTLAALILAWNTANQTEKLTLTSGDGTQKPSAGHIALSGGIDAVPARAHTVYTFPADYVITQTDITAEYDQELAVNAAMDKIEHGKRIMATITALNKSKLTAGTLTASDIQTLIITSVYANAFRCLLTGNLNTAKTLLSSVGTSFYTSAELTSILSSFPALGPTDP